MTCFVDRTAVSVFVSLVNYLVQCVSFCCQSKKKTYCSGEHHYIGNVAYEIMSHFARVGEKGYRIYEVYSMQNTPNISDKDEISKHA